MSDRLQLFHLIADTGSAKVRHYVADHELLDAVAFRNVSFDEHRAALEQHGGDVARVPALFDGVQLFVGADAVIARLKAHGDVGRA